MFNTASISQLHRRCACSKVYLISLFSLPKLNRSSSPSRNQRAQNGVDPSKNRKKKKKKQNYTLKELKSLGNDLLSSRAHINSLPLLRLAAVRCRIYPLSLQSSSLSASLHFFTPLFNDDNDDSSKTTEVDEDPEVIFKAWLASTRCSCLSTVRRYAKGNSIIFSCLF